MTQLIVAFLSGLLFAVGLIVSGMSNPAKVLNFLDIAQLASGTISVVMFVVAMITGVLAHKYLAEPFLVGSRTQEPLQ